LFKVKLNASISQRLRLRTKKLKTFSINCLLEQMRTPRREIVFTIQITQSLYRESKSKIVYTLSTIRRLNSQAATPICSVITTKTRLLAWAERALNKTTSIIALGKALLQ